MKIGILGGTLDPVHNGHIDIALAAMSARASDKLDRLRMAELATEGREGLYASDLEIRRLGPTYTVDTLSALTVEHPEVEWVYILGADALNKLDTWREFPRIARLCAFAAVSRPGCDEDLARLRARAIGSCYHTRVDLLNVSGPPLSSTSVRKRVAEGLPIDDCVPPRVAAYIRERGLYLCKYGEAQILERLKGMLTDRRFIHTLGVADTAERLAPRCGVDVRRARLAGLLHDCAKSMPLEDMRAMVMEHLPDLDAEELETRAILHAPAGMVLAQNLFGVRDPAILRAIRKHTVGDGSMSPMDALIYVSDFIEPGREPFPGLDKARKLAEKDIYRAMCCCARLTEKHLKSRGQHMHPRTQALLDNYEA